MVWQGGLACQDFGRLPTAILVVAFDTMLARPTLPVFRAFRHTSEDSETRHLTYTALVSI
ncbi:MAG: hypothetical protein WA996_18230 [Candidatus Promineifilaceae bacterium]